MTVYYYVSEPRLQMQKFCSSCCCLLTPSSSSVAWLDSLLSGRVSEACNSPETPCVPLQDVMLPSRGFR